MKHILKCWFVLSDNLVMYDSEHNLMHKNPYILGPVNIKPIFCGALAMSNQILECWFVPNDDLIMYGSKHNLMYRSLIYFGSSEYQSKLACLIDIL